MTDHGAGGGQDAQTFGVNPWLIAISVMLATFMEVLDTAIATVALPYIAGSLSASTDEATWVLTSYLVANAVILPASSWFSIKFGRKRFLMTCVLLFTAASFFVGAAPTLAFILIARVVQGAGGGALQPLAQSILLESFPPARRGAAMAFYAFGIVVAPVLGPTLGGWLTDSYSWRYAFYINIPVGILATFMIGRFVNDPPYISKAKASPFDGLGFGLLAIWSGCLQIVLDKGQEDDWFGAPWIRWATLILVISFIWFVVHCWRSKTPLVNLRVLKDRNFAVGCLLMFMLGAALYSTITVLPLFYQELLGYTAFAAGLVVGPRGIGSILGMPLIGYINDKMDARVLLSIGFIGFGICSIVFGNVNLAIGPWTLFWPIVITGMSMSFIFVPITTQAYGTLSNEQIGNASGIFNLVRNIGGGIGISVAQTLIVRRAAFHQTEISSSVPISSYWLQERMGDLTRYLGRYTYSSNAAGPARGEIYRQAVAQARLWAFVDIFRWTAVVAFLSVGVVWLFRKVKHGRGPAAAH
ncbi:MAG TPA: DHA2 family efflux MFS transporter permease subunit [Acidobacteriaceae bacterium]|nr:DHA2 family efflux MFS transporter permease subunit [Acidobacteriaceae bacterium]